MLTCRCVLGHQSLQPKGAANRGLGLGVGLAEVVALALVEAEALAAYHHSETDRGRPYMDLDPPVSRFFRFQFARHSQILAR